MGSWFHIYAYIMQLQNLPTSALISLLQHLMDQWHLLIFPSLLYIGHLNQPYLVWCGRLLTGSQRERCQVSGLCRHILKTATSCSGILSLSLSLSLSHTHTHTHTQHTHTLTHRTGNFKSRVKRDVSSAPQFRIVNNMTPIFLLQCTCAY